MVSGDQDRLGHSGEQRDQVLISVRRSRCPVSRHRRAGRAGRRHGHWGLCGPRAQRGLVAVTKRSGEKPAKRADRFMPPAR